MLNPMDMTGRCVMVTGASSGIGRETSILLSELGAQLILVARNRSRLEETRSVFRGQNHSIETCDLSELDQIPAWLKRISEQSGPISGLVHCAGMQMTLPLNAIEASQVRSMTDLNLASAVMLAKGISQNGVFAPQCSIVFLSSVMGLVGAAGLSLYSASKGALIGLTRSLSIELVRKGIRVNSVAPAFVDSEMFQQMKGLLSEGAVAKIESAHPLGIGKPRDVAHAVAFLLADTGRWITGTTLVVDGGYTAQGARA